jgi:hypothetical protein
MTNISTLDDAKSSTRLCGDFNKMREEVIREVGENQNEVDRRLTERILPNFIIRLHMEKNREHYLEKKIEQFQEKKRKQNLEKKKEQYLKKALEKKKKKKRVAFRIVDPKKQFYSEKVNKNQEKEEEDSWYVREFNMHGTGWRRVKLQIYYLNWNLNYHFNLLLQWY